MTSVLTARKLSHASTNVNLGRLAIDSTSLYITGGLGSTPFLLKTNLALGDLTGSLANHAGFSWSNVTDITLVSQTLPTASTVSNGITTKTLSNTTTGPSVTAGSAAAQTLTTSSV
jgi:hypothetical protein